MGDSTEGGRAKGETGYLGTNLLTSGQHMWRTRVRHEKEAAEAAAAKHASRPLARNPTHEISSAAYDAAVSIQTDLRSQLEAIQRRPFGHGPRALPDRPAPIDYVAKS